mmetsp:Transcript_54228/g.101665  ORF Transcript_54228/g.101665 Transcript_54228/m.101665 type:complete len:365 (+) Transcript_54228:125-1219(+)
MNYKRSVPVNMFVSRLSVGRVSNGCVVWMQMLLSMLLLLNGLLIVLLIVRDPQQGRPRPTSVMDSEAMTMKLWERWLNGPGVTIKMFECPQWESPATFGECVEYMLKSYQASVMRFDLPGVNFIQSQPVGFVYRADPLLQWCANPGDIGSLGAGCGIPSTMTKEAYLEDYWIKRKEWPWPAFSPPMHVSWETAFEYQHFLISNIAPKWTEEDKCYYKANQFCQLYNEVTLRDPTVSDVEAIIVRKYARDDDAPDGPLKEAKALRSYMRDNYGIDLPIVEYKWLEEECYDPQAIVKRWDKGRAEASNSMFFPISEKFLEPGGYDESMLWETPSWVTSAQQQLVQDLVVKACLQEIEPAMKLTPEK